jgi:23S rRNA (uridine2552-2'-O)-methyltransferase
MLPVPGCQFVQGNFGDISVQDHITALMGGRKADVILSDMASQSCGHPATDHLRIMSICELVFEFAQLNLAKNGTVVTKMWLGGGEHELVSNVRPFFTKVSYFKPKASRSDSAEMYLLASGFKM